MCAGFINRHGLRAWKILIDNIYHKKEEATNSSLYFLAMPTAGTPAVELLLGLDDADDLRSQPSSTNTTPRRTDCTVQK